MTNPSVQSGCEIRIDQRRRCQGPRPALSCAAMLPTVITPRPAARFLAAGLLLASALAAAQPKAEAPKAKGPSSFEPPEPFVPVSAFRVPDDLEVTLWARTPLFRNPANIDIDAQGRIWIAESYNYRRHAGKDPAGDRIVVLEDSDGDGVADRSQVFVQDPGLLAPMGVAVIDNKIIVSCTPDLIVYTDVNRDGKFDPAVDKREVLLTGFDGRVARVASEDSFVPLGDAASLVLLSEAEIEQAALALCTARSPDRIA